jgi:hypothetical protein
MLCLLKNSMGGNRNDEYGLAGTLKRKGNLSSAFEKADSSIFMTNSTFVNSKSDPGFGSALV